MLQNTVWLVNKMRQIGMKIFHAPMSFNIDGSDNPNKNLGVLHGCFSDNLYVRGKVRIWGLLIKMKRERWKINLLVKGIEPPSVGCESKMLITTLQVLMCRDKKSSVSSTGLEYQALGSGIRANLIFSDLKVKQT